MSRSSQLILITRSLLFALSIISTGCLLLSSLTSGSRRLTSMPPSAKHYLALLGTATALLHKKADIQVK